MHNVMNLKVQKSLLRGGERVHTDISIHQEGCGNILTSLYEMEGRFHQIHTIIKKKKLGVGSGAYLSFLGGECAQILPLKLPKPLPPSINF